MIMHGFGVPFKEIIHPFLAIIRFEVELGLIPELS